MKKTTYLFLAFALLFSCAKETGTYETYTLSVTAGKGEWPEAKALVIDELGGGKLEAKWAAGEEVKVYKGATLLGTLTAQGSGKSTTLRGEISGDIKQYDLLSLKFLSPDYATQNGTLKYIAEHCDYATATVVILKIDGDSVTTNDAFFENQQAIVEFQLRNAGNTADLSVDALLIDADGQTITVTPATSKKVLWAAIPALSAKPVTLQATAGSRTFLTKKSEVTLEAGQYYAITPRLTEFSIVHNQAELFDAVENNGAHILFAGNITVGHNVQITDNRTVTIDMDGYTLDRGLTARGNDGQCFFVAGGSTLNLSNGTLTRGWGGDSGGLLNYGTATLTDVTLRGCTGDDRGGGICNNGTLMLKGCTIQYNNAAKSGGGIWNGSDAALFIDGGSIQNNICGQRGGGIFSQSSFDMQGAITVNGNTSNSIANNIDVSKPVAINVTGSLAGSSIGITRNGNDFMEQTGAFTSGYDSYNNGVNPATIFTADQDDLHVTLSDALEAKLAAPEISYIERSWDSEHNAIAETVRTIDEYFVLKGSTDAITYLTFENCIVQGDVSYNRLRYKEAADKTYNIILCDGAHLHAKCVHLDCSDNQYTQTLNIFGQEGGTGRLTSDARSLSSDIIGIGVTNDSFGTVNFHGGMIEAYGLNEGSGIGVTTSAGAFGGNINIYGGNITAVGGDEGAGINARSTVCIYGGTVNATGGEDGGAGIGNIYYGSGHVDVYIYDGTVTATGGSDYAPGIGCSYKSWGDNLAGIVSITGGQVLTRGYRGIGPAKGIDVFGTLSLGDRMQVRPKFYEGWGAPVLAGERVNTCRSNTIGGAWIKVCNHPDHTPEDCPYCVH